MFSVVSPPQGKGKHFLSGSAEAQYWLFCVLKQTCELDFMSCLLLFLRMVYTGVASGPELGILAVIMLLW